jgi:hypothetical protein
MRASSRPHLFSHPYYTPLMLARALLRICMSASGFRWSWGSIAQSSYLFTRIWEALPRSGGYLNMKGDPRKSVKWIHVCHSVCLPPRCTRGQPIDKDRVFVGSPPSSSSSPTFLVPGPSSTPRDPEEASPRLLQLPFFHIP